jgi:hypothetical protein
MLARMRVVVLLALTGVACWRSVGGTAGPPAVACAAGDRTCLQVRTSLERIRDNIGAECGTPEVEEAEALGRLGAAAVPYLLEAVADRDLPVANTACHLAVRHGVIPELRAACARSQGPTCCAHLEAWAAVEAELDLRVLGRWHPHDRALPSLTIHTPESATWCEADGCVPVTLRRVGFRLEVALPTGPRWFSLLPGRKDWRPQRGPITLLPEHEHFAWQP